MHSAGTIFARPQSRQGMPPAWTFRVLGCRCGKCRSIVDHKRLKGAEACARRIIEQRKEQGSG